MSKQTADEVGRIPPSSQSIFVAQPAILLTEEEMLVGNDDRPDAGGMAPIHLEDRFDGQFDRLLRQLAGGSVPLS